MKYYLAPLEGITKYIFRNAYHRHFKPMDRYFAPFLSPTQNISFKPREIADILPENNQALPLVPQILTNRADAFLWAAETLSEMGYEEVNLNLGCPSRTVVSKRRGSGFLADQSELERFLTTVFDHWNGKVSIKTRIGVENPDEWAGLMQIYNQFPLSELIIHPRLQRDYYTGTPDFAAFGQAVRECHHPLCYNGDLFVREDYEKMCAAFPDVDRVMLGRGILCNPGLLTTFETGDLPGTEQIRAFLTEIREAYSEIFSGEKNVLYKLKEIWCYLLFLFPEDAKSAKKIKKATTIAQYLEAENEILSKQQPVGRRLRADQV